MTILRQTWEVLLDFVTLGAERGNPFALSVLLVAGVTALLAGRRLFWIFAAIVGYSLGATIAPLIVSPIPGIYTVLQIGLAVLAALIAIAAASTSTYLVTFLGVSLLGLLLIIPYQVPPWGELLASLLAGLAGVALLHVAWDSTLIGLSAFYGAVAVLGATARLIPATRTLESGALFTAMVATGIVVQTVALVAIRRQPLEIPTSAGGVYPTRRRAIRRRERRDPRHD
jgi:hypothetical protein